MCDCCRQREERDKAMWLGIARALGTVANGITGVVRSIEKRYTDKSIQDRRAA